jgi:RHS repeat-associated protein
MDTQGNILRQYAYSPFGTTATAGFGGTTPFQFTGRENDGTGLYYYRNRYYSPEWGRFVSEDPIGMGEGSANLYAYAGNNPMNFNDPHGLFVNYLVGAGTNVAMGWALAKLTGQSYSWQNALVDAGTGALGVGIIGKASALLRAGNAGRLFFHGADFRGALQLETARHR